MSHIIHRQALRLTLLDDCVFSERNATEGGHRGLSRIPGQTLLGAAAAKLYGKLAARGDAAYTAFHSGQVRFLDGLPSDGKAIAYPVPFAWHRPKSGGNQALAHNFARGKAQLPGGAQPKQMREGYVFADGRHLEPGRGLRMKTAIDPKTGHAAEGQLFGYESLSRGQTFIAWVEADEPAKGLLDEIVAALLGQALLGRSRSAEYGRVRIETQAGVAEPDHGAVNGNTLTLWLLSDLALVGPDGRPTLEPSAAALGLSDTDAAIDWSRTFLRSRRYSPWNAHRHGYDRERLLLTAGGVITLELHRAPTPEQLNQLKAGVGLYRESGLGRLWVEPPLLAQETIALAPFKADAPPPAEVPDDPLLGWLKEQTTDWRTPLDEQAKRLAGEVAEVLQAGCRRRGIRKGENFGPSKSQWGRVLETARNNTGQELYSALFSSEDAVIKRAGEGWGEIIEYDRGEPVHAADWLRNKLAVGETPATHYAYLIRRLAHRLRGDTKRQVTQQGDLNHG